LFSLLEGQFLLTYLSIILFLQGTSKLPHTVVNTEWAAATRAMNAAKERVSADPIRLNPVGGNW
jgi:hypothetical protein